MSLNITHAKKPSSYIKQGSYSFDYPCSSHFDCSPYSVLASKGVYLLEVWSASGGDRGDGMAGEGGYSYGVINFRSLTKLFVEVGGSGILASGTQIQGGYNGGGFSKLASDSKYGTGGGATDIRIENDDLLSRVIVAGAGGGSGFLNSKDICYGKGGYGGGLIAGSGNNTCNVISSSIASQTMNILKCTEDSCWCGSGGGWANGDWGRGGGTSGGGGSGFIFTAKSTVPSDFKLKRSYMLKRAKTLDKTVGFPSPTGVFEYDHIGHGYARITILSNTICTICSRRKSFIDVYILTICIFLS